MKTYAAGGKESQGSSGQKGDVCGQGKTDKRYREQGVALTFMEQELPAAE